MKGLKVALALGAMAIMFFATAPTTLQEDVSSVRPGGLYSVSITVTKPAGMSLSSDWEIRAYYYNGGLSCYNTGDWWQPEGSTDYIYSGWYDHRVRNQAWTTPDEKAFTITTQLVNYPRGDEGPAFPAGMDNTYSGTMVEIPSPTGTAKLRTRLLFRNLAEPTFNGDQVTFKVGGITYTYAYEQVGSDYDLKTADGSAVGTGATLTLSSSDEWELKYDSTQDLIVDNSAAATGTITMSSPIVMGLASAGSDVTVFVGVGAVVVVVALVAIFMFKKKRSGGMAGSDIAPPPPSPPEAPPTPPKTPDVPGFTL